MILKRIQLETPTEKKVEDKANGKKKSKENEQFHFSLFFGLIMNTTNVQSYLIIIHSTWYMVLVESSTVA